MHDKAGGLKDPESFERLLIYVAMLPNLPGLRHSYSIPARFFYSSIKKHMHWDWQHFYTKASDWVLASAPRFLGAILFCLIGLWITRRIDKWLKASFERRNINPSIRYFIRNFIIIALQIGLFTIAFQIAGIQLTFLTAVVAGLSVAFGLALSGTLQNFMSGLLILLLHPFRVGDRIITQGQEGKVSSIQLFYTVVLTSDNKTIIIPNGQLSNNVIVNLSREGKRRFDIELKLGYNIDIDGLKQALTKSIKTMKDVLNDPAYRIGITAIDGDKYTLKIELWTTADDFQNTQMIVNEKIITDLKQSGIKLPGMT